MASTQYLILCLLQTVIAVASKKTNNIKDDVSIGIVGAGMAGLFSAFHLSTLGYKNITIYEKTARVGGVIKSFPLSDGRPFDMHTMWIPDSSIYGAGVPASMKYILDSFNVTLEFSDRQGTVVTPDGEYPENNLIYENLHIGTYLLKNVISMSRTQIIKLHVEGFHLLKKYRSCVDRGISCTDCGICANAFELPFEYAARTNSRNLMLSLNALVNSLGTGPSSEVEPYRTADYVFKVCSIWYPATMAQTFDYFGVTAQELKNYNSTAEMIEIRESNNHSGAVGYYYVKEGFQGFAQAIANKFEVKLNTEIVSTQKDIYWKIKTKTNETLLHDILILANPPRIESEKRMFPSGEIKSAMNLIDTSQPGTQTVLFDIGNSTWDSDKFPAKVNFNRLFLQNAPNPMFGFIIKRFADLGVVEIATGQWTGFADDDLAAISADRLRSLLAGENDSQFTMLAHSFVMFPPIPLPKDEIKWQDYMLQIEALREDKDIFVVGEHVCGTGVVELAICVNRTFSSLTFITKEDIDIMSDDQSDSCEKMMSFGLLWGIFLTSLLFA